MPHYFFKATGLLIFLVLMGCSESQNTHDDVWVKEELLTELYALREDVASLRMELSTLSEKLDSMPEKAYVAQAKPTPDPVPDSIDLPTHSLIGEAGAKIAIVEFTDFQCPFCARHAKTVLPELKKNYIETGKIQYAIADFPLGIHGQARQAAIAARCAGKQNQYWRLHDELFANAASVSRAEYSAMAGKIGLDIKPFNRCMKDPVIARSVDQSVANGSSYGVRGTPKFFVGKIRDGKLVDISPISGAAPLSTFKAVIDAKL